MSKKYLSLTLLPLIAGCSLGGSTPADFPSLYQAHIDSQIESLREVGKDLGYGQKSSYDGSMRFAAALPGFMSGVLSTEYTSKIDSQDLEFLAKNLELSYDAQVESGSLALESFGITSLKNDAYFLFSGLTQSNILGSSMMDVLAKYENTWLSLTEKDMDKALEGMSSDEILSYQISEVLSRWTLEDVQGYLTKYPLFTQTGDLGMSGGLQGYAVVPNSDNIIALFDELYTEFTGKKMDEDTKKVFREDIVRYNITGNFYFDPKNPETMNLALTVSPQNEEKITLNWDQSPDKFHMELASGVSSLTFDINNPSDNEKSVSLVLGQDGSELGRLNATMKYRDKSLSNLDMTVSAPAQGVSMTVKHQNNVDGTFAGDMNAGIANMSWSGAVEKGTLTALSLKGAAVGTQLNLSLTSTPGTDMIRGPLSVSSGGDTIFTSDIGLRVAPGRVSLSVEASLPSMDGEITPQAPKALFDMDIIGKKGDFSGKIQAPQDTKPFQELIDALSAVAESEAFLPEESLTPIEDEALLNSLENAQ